MSHIGVAILGAGGIANAHAAAYKAHPEARVVAVFDVDAQRAQAAAQKWEAEAMSYDAILGDARIQAISICTPPGVHAELAVAALEAGKHVLVEKPIAPTLAEADRMIAAAKRTGRTLMVGHTHRYWPVNVRAKELIENGEIGELIMATDDALSTTRVQDGVVPWRLQKAVAGGGVVMDNGIHIFDRLSWWFDRPVESVFARTSTVLDDIDVENNCEAMLTFAGGAYATTRLSFTAPKHAGRCVAEFLGTEGFMSVETWGALTVVRHGEEPKVYPVDEQKSGMLLEIEDFLHCVRTGDAPRASATAGRFALEMVLAVYESAHSGSVVALAQSA